MDTNIFSDVDDIFNNISFSDEPNVNFGEFEFETFPDTSNDTKLVIKSSGINNTIMDLLRVLQEEDPALECLSIQKCNEDMNFRFYYQGYTGEFVSRMGEDIHMLQEEEKNIRINITFDSEIEVIESAVRHFFRQIYNSMRIQNLFDPPKKYFALCTSKMRGITKQTQTDIYDIIKAKCDPETIERELARQWRSGKENHLALSLSYTDFNLIRLLDYYFIVVNSSKGTRIECFHALQREKAFNCYDRIIDDFVNEEKQKTKENIKNLYSL